MLLVLLLAFQVPSTPTGLGVSAVSSLADRVLVIVNTAIPGSQIVADHYRAVRGIPAANVCAIIAPDDGGGYMGTAADYVRVVRDPIRACLASLGPRQILYIVFAYHTPMKMFDPVTWSDSIRSTDSFVADLWQPTLLPFYNANPYSAATVPFATWSDRPTIMAPVYSVWRLDAPTVAQALGLIDTAVQAEQQGASGIGCFDRRYMDPVQDSSYGAGDVDIQMAYDAVSAAGFQAILDKNDAEVGTAPAPLRCDHALLYAGWYAYGHYNDAFSWAPGAVGVHLDSLSLYNLRDPSSSWSAGAIAAGITGTAGAVAEPFLNYLPHPRRLFPHLLAGWNLGDAMFQAEDGLDWMIVNVGDPLYRPFP